MNQELENSNNNKIIKKSKVRPIRSYGRIKSRKLSNYKKDLLSNFLPNLLVKDCQELELLVAKGQFDSNILEIGSGFGDFIIAKSQNQPRNFFLAVEPHLNGIVSVLSKIAESSISNIRISNQDVREFLISLKKPLFNHIYILFPDPWPKKKHNKRRLINSQFLDFLANISADNADLTIATDDDEYKAIITASILQNNNWHWSLESKSNWQEFPADWTSTKYQNKAVAEGRKSAIFLLKKP